MTSIETPSGKNSYTENFPVGSFLIKKDLRRHVHAFYIFARAADDIGDNPILEAREKISRLNMMASALEKGKDDGIKSVAPLIASLKETGVSPQHSLDLLTAFKRDATKSRYADWDELLDYCRYSASPVGRHVLALHGMGSDVWPANDALCTALQIINHIQDCGDDYRELDRVYIPQDMLLACGSSVDDLSRDKLTDGLRRTVEAMLDKMRPMLAEANKFPLQITDFRLKLEVSVICSLANSLVDLLRHKDPLNEDVKLGKTAKTAATIKGLLRACLAL